MASLSNFARMKKSCPVLLCLLTAAAAAVPHAGLAAWHNDEQAIMGTSIRVEVFHDDAAFAREGMWAVMAEMHRIDHLMSPFREDSELSLANREAADHAVKISRELFDLIKRSLDFSRLSDGAFDITFSSVGYLYDYRKGVKPSDEQISAALPGINYRNLILDPRESTIKFARQGVRIDLGGIAKGYAVDNAINLLRAMGFREALVTAGGDSRILGDKHGRPWMTGIRDPRKAGESLVVIPLSNAAISTSGDYERYFERDGVRYHHIIDPKTGKSAGATRSATVIGPDATTTDALSTTLFILGWEKALKLVDSLPDIGAVIIDSAGQMHYSADLEPPKPRDH